MKGENMKLIKTIHTYVHKAVRAFIQFIRILFTRKEYLTETMADTIDRLIQDNEKLIEINTKAVESNANLTKRLKDTLKVVDDLTKSCEDASNKFTEHKKKTRELGEKIINLNHQLIDDNTTLLDAYRNLTKIVKQYQQHDSVPVKETLSLISKACQAVVDAHVKANDAYEQMVEDEEDQTAV